MEQLMKILKDIRPDVDFDNATDLIDICPGNRLKICNDRQRFQGRY